MREIKFRGLTTNNGWVYGDLRKDMPGETVYYNEYSQRICWDYSNAPVKNGTVGQYTGLKDKNDKEIYEDDILFFEPFGTHNNDRVVKYYNGGFVGELIRNGYLENLNEMSIHMFEVIGNIYENKDLLEVENER